MGNSGDPNAEIFDPAELPSHVADDPGDGGADGGGDEGGDPGAGDDPGAAAAAEGDRGRAPAGSDAVGARGQGDRGRAGGKPDQYPAHRFDQLNARFDQLQRETAAREERLVAENRRLRTALGVEQPRDERPRLNERQQRLRSEIMRLVPELGVLSDQRLRELMERSQDIGRIVEHYPQASAEERRRWSGHGERMVRQVLSHAAQQWHGQGKGAADLDPEDRADLDAAFVRWVTRRAQNEQRELPDGQYGETTLRYEAADPGLITEFWSWYTRRHGNAAGGGQEGQRRAGADAAARAAAAGRTPRGGSSSAPVGSAGRQVKPRTIDDALDEGWSYVQQQRAGAG